MFLGGVNLYFITQPLFYLLFAVIYALLANLCVNENVNEMSSCVIVEHEALFTY